MPTKQIGLRIDVDLLANLTNRAEREHRTLSNLIVSILMEEKEKGKWIFSSNDSEGVCSICNYKIFGKLYNSEYLIVPYNFCPNCGSDMRG